MDVTKNSKLYHMLQAYLSFNFNVQFTIKTIDKLLVFLSTQSVFGLISEFPPHSEKIAFYENTHVQ